MTHLLIQADARKIPLPDRSVDLVFGSPPYTDCRTYGIGAQRNAREWVAWMLDVTTEALRVSRGAVLWVVGGATRNRTYQPACEGLAWEWFLRHGHSNVFQDGIELPGEAGSAYRPCYWHRVGIPGSGGDQWFRADVEYVLCFKRPGKLPWTDNTAMGHPPKWAPGGEMSHRLSDGTRRNQWGSSQESMKGRTADNKLINGNRPSHRYHTKRMKTTGPRGDVDEQAYIPPAKANPGTLIKGIPVGGNLLGSPMAHENEAPFPEALAEWFIASLCPPGGTVIDCFSGSGTTVAATERLGRHGIGLDIRASQCELSKRRVERPHKPTSTMVKRAKPEEAFALKGLS